jgi:hypothetical protein
VNNTSVGGATFSGAAGAGDIGGDVVNQSGSTLNAGSFTHTLAGNFTNNGTFSGTGSTISFTGAAKTLGGTGSTSFGDVAIATGASYTLNSDASATALTLNAAATANSLTQATGTTLSVTGAVTMNHPSANTVTSAWNINAGTATVSGLISFPAAENTASRVAKIAITSGTLNANGGISFTGTGTAPASRVIDMSGGAGTLNLKGAWTTVATGAGSGTLTAGTAGSNFNYADSNPQTVPFTFTGAYNNLVLNNAAGATLGAAITATNVTGSVSVQSGTLNNNGNAVTLASGKSFSISNGATFNLGGSSTMVTVSGGGTKTFGTTSTVNYAGTTQAVSAETYGNLSTSGSATKTLSSNVTVKGDLSIGSGTTLASASSAGLVLEGNWTNAGTFSAGTSTVQLQGGNAQTVAATTFNLLAVTKSGGNVTLTGDVTTSNLNLQSSAQGNIVTGSNTVIVTGSPGVSRTASATNNFVEGNLRKPIASGASSPTFEVGTGSTYAPISLSITGANAGGTLTALTTGSQHASYSTSGLNQTKYVNRYWTLTAGSGLTVTGYDATFTFAAGDLVGSPNTAALLVKRFSVGTWTAPTSSSSTSTTVTGTGFGAAFGDYASGN